jgi:hypothetical protein
VGGVRRGRFLGSGGGWFGPSYYESLSFTTVGIPLEAQVFFTPFSFLGIGMCGFANLNPEKPYAGALLCLKIGKLR